MQFLTTLPWALLLISTGVRASPYTTTSPNAATTTRATSIASTTTSRPRPEPTRGPSCKVGTPEQVANETTGIGGCSSNCYCDQRKSGAPGAGVCDITIDCSPNPCEQDGDCPGTKACVSAPCKDGRGSPGFNGSSCVDTTGCTSTHSLTGRSVPLFGQMRWAD